jgi:N-acetylglucosamine-6-phosphate deacetylase
MNHTDSEEIWVHCDTLFTPFQRRRNWLLHITQGKIRRMLPAADVENIPPERLIHEPDAIVAPGFIDLHVHGASGHDLMDGTSASLQAVSKTLARYGTTAFLATTMSATDADIESALRGIAAHRSHLTEGAHAIGIHMEGPYLNPLRRGTHDARFLKKAEIRNFLRFVEASANTIRRLTLAPEMDPGLEVIREVSALGIQVSLGHSDAAEEQARAAIDAGATHATHTFNAMRPFHQREPGILGAALTDDRVYTEVIADGIHVHPTALQLLLRIKGVERTPLVTDGSSAVGMPDGRYPLGGAFIEVKQGECRDGEGNLAGSALTLDRAVRNLVEWLDLPLHEALTAASATPARCMRMGDSKGIIFPGADADLVFLGRELQVLRTVVAGRTVYARPPASSFDNPAADVKL